MATVSLDCPDQWRGDPFWLIAGKMIAERDQRVADAVLAWLAAPEKT